MCLFGGLAVGVSGFSSDSNHPTYLPPMLHYLDAGYLAKDWWLASARHYHFAFFAIAAVLTPPDIGSQLLLAIPLCLLYELALIGIWLTERKRRKVAGTAVEKA